MKVQQITFVSQGQVQFTSVDFPDTLLPHQLLLKTEYTLISPGTEYDVLTNQIGNVRYPSVLGYSAVARVVKTGEAVTEFREGDRCLCYHSSHRSYQIMTCDQLAKIEFDTLPPEEALFCVVGCMGFQGVRRCRPELGESAIVLGAGLLGQFAMQTFRLCGAYPVICLDFHAFRREKALQYGADAAFSPEEKDLPEKIRSLTGNHTLCNNAVEVTGNPQALIQALTLMAPAGRISLVGCSRTPTKELDFYNLVHKPGIQILGAHNMARPLHDGRPGVWTMKEDMKTLLRYMAGGRLHSRHLITDILDPARAPAAYSRLVQKDPGLLGTVFDWNNC